MALAEKQPQSSIEEEKKGGDDITDFVDDTSHSNEEFIDDDYKGGYFGSIMNSRNPTIKERIGRSYLIVQVIDTGVGISEED